MSCSVLITGVFLSLRGDVVPNHGYVVISDIGSTDDTALLCNTDRRVNGYNSGGDWFVPDETSVDGGYGDITGFRRNRAPKIVRLLRNTATDPPSEGIYHCQMKDAAMTVRRVYVGLYNSSRGMNVHFSLFGYTARPFLHRIHCYT